MWIRCTTDDHNIVIHVRIQCNSTFWEIVVSRYCLMMALWTETCRKIIPEILIIVVLWRIIKESINKHNRIHSLKNPKVIPGGVTEIGWSTIVHEPHQVRTAVHVWTECGFTALQIFLLRKFSMVVLVKPASSVKSTRLLREGSSLHWRRNHLQHPWPGLESSGLRACSRCEWCGYSSCSWRIYHITVWATFLTACVGQRSVCGFPSKRPNMRSSQQLFVHWSVFCSLP
jgi:hypothetical protein